VTIFISTHFMNEAERCDRISLMHAGKVLASDTPQALVEQRGAASLEEAFIAWLKEAQPSSPVPEEPTPVASHPNIRLRARPSVFAGCLATAAAKRWSCAAIRYDRRWRCWAR
jgi:ABC-type uncharacterized transport system ATPase subunit